MNREEYAVMFEAEERHWWYRGMAAITDAILDQQVGRGRVARILDAGCGTGATSRALEARGSVTGIDLSAEALRFCRDRALSRIARASIAHLPFADACFELATSFDVLCSLGPDDESRALRECFRVLRPGGHLFLRLPAYDWLRGKHDRAVHIRHRYTRRELARKLADVGFEVGYTGHANCALFPVAALVRLSEPLRGGEREGSDLQLGTGAMNRLLAAVLSSEARVVPRLALPFGLTVMAVAHKPGVAAGGPDA